MKAFFILLIFTAFGHVAAGQPTWTARAELPIQSNNSEFAVWPLPDSSTLVLNQESSFRRSVPPFTFFRLDKDLVLSWQNPAAVPKNSKFLQACFNGQTGYFLFEGERAAEYLLLKVNTVKGTQILSHHYLPENMTFKLTGLQVLDGQLFLTGTQNDRLTVLHLNAQERELAKLPAIYDQASALTEFLADTVAHRMEFILAETNGLKGRLQAKRLSPDGKLYSINFFQSSDRNFLAARLSPGDSTKKIITGTYSLRDLRYAQGFFTGQFLNPANKDLKFYDFTTFSHFFDYLKPTRRDKLLRKVARFRLTSKIFQLRQRMLLHSLIPYQNGYLLAGELYSPHYYNEGGNARIFDGYEFSQVIVAAFDATGNLRWENSLPVQHVKVFEVTETVTIGAYGERVFLCYPDDDKIRYKVISGDQTSPNELIIDIPSLQTTERIQNTKPEGLAYWYKNNFLTYGVQQIRGKAGTRTVFFLNKLSF